LFKKPSPCVSDLQEAVFSVQGVLTDFLLPLYEKLPKTKPFKYQHLRQGVTISGLDTAVFDKAIAASQEIFGMFDRVFSQGSLSSWNLTDSNGLSLEASNRYFHSYPGRSWS